LPLVGLGEEKPQAGGAETGANDTTALPKQASGSPSPAGTSATPGKSSPEGEARTRSFVPALPQSRTAGQRGSPGATAGRPEGQPPEASQEAQSGPVQPRMLRSPGGGPARPAPPLSRLTGNRDYVIAVECRADEVVLRPWGTRFPVGQPGGT